MASVALADVILRGIAEWNLAAIEPTHIVLSRDALATLADDGAVDPYAIGPLRLWGLPCVIAGVEGWALGTDRPQDAMQVMPLSV